MSESYWVANQIIIVEIDEPITYNVDIRQKITLPSNTEIFTSMLPNAKVTWTKDGQDITNQTLGEHQFFRNYELTIEDFNDLDSGLYECKVYDNLLNRMWITQRIKVKQRTEQYFIILVVNNEKIIRLAFFAILVLMGLSFLFTLYRYKLEILKLILED